MSLQYRTPASSSGNRAAGSSIIPQSESNIAHIIKNKRRSNASQNSANVKLKPTV